MAKIDLDLIENEPRTLIFKKKKYSVPEPTLRQELQHWKLTAELDGAKARLEVLQAADEPDLNAVYEQVEKIQELNMSLEGKIFELFIPGFKAHEDMTERQRKALFQFLFPDADSDGGKKKVKGQEEENSPGEK